MTRINRLEIANVKRVRAVTLEPSPHGLTVIGGKNRAGKTGILDAILWALGGDKYKPDNPQRDGSMVPPEIRIELSNGLTVERSGQNSSLKVTDAAGNKAGQSLLNSLISILALDLPKFLNSTGKEKARTLLEIIGVGKQLIELETKEQKLFNERHAVGQIVIRKKKHAEDLPFDADAPATEVSAGELIQQQQGILQKNAENQSLRARWDELKREHGLAVNRAADLSRQLRDTNEQVLATGKKCDIAEAATTNIEDTPTAALEQQLTEIDAINQRVRVNATKAAAEAEAAIQEEEYVGLTGSLEAVRQERMQLLEGADMPLPGLSVESGELVYDKQTWDGMSAAEQMRVGVAIVRRLQPDCQFVLLDKTEQMDVDTLREFGKWAESEDLQIIATRVSTSGECSIIIEDGLVVDSKPATPLDTWPSLPDPTKGGF